MKLVILDRDGTINEGRGDFVTSADDWVPLPGALEAIARLNHAGFHIVVVSNQPGLGRGLFDVASLNAMHTKMHRMLAAVGGRIDAVFYCPHGPEDACTCRMPLPGLFEQIAERWGVSLAGMPVVGDSLRDLVAGAAVGCAPHLVLTGAFAQSRLAPAAEDRQTDSMQRLALEPLPAGFPTGTLVHANLSAFADVALREGASAPARAPS